MLFVMATRGPHLWLQKVLWSYRNVRENLSKYLPDEFVSPFKERKGLIPNNQDGDVENTQGFRRGLHKSTGDIMFTLSMFYTDCGASSCFLGH